LSTDMESHIARKAPGSNHCLVSSVGTISRKCLIHPEKFFCWTYYHWGSTGHAQAPWHLLIFQVVSCPSQKNQVQATPHEQLHPMGR
jgi:hypothetical protein